MFWCWVFYENRDYLKLPESKQILSGLSMWKSKKTIFSLFSLSSLGVASAWLTFFNKGVATVKTGAEVGVAVAQTIDINTDTIIKQEQERRDKQRYVSDLYQKIASTSTVERQDAVDNLVKYVGGKKEDRIAAIQKLAEQIRQESPVSPRNAGKKTPENRRKTQVLLNAIINISAEGEDLRNYDNPNQIGLDYVNLYDATLISDVIERKVKLYLSFNHSIMTESILGGLDLTKASLVDTNLDGSGLKGTILSGANLSDSSLVGADLTDADLTSATLTKANLENANLTRTDISNARGITSKQISETCYWEKSTGIAEKLKPKARPLKNKVNACDNMWRRK